MFNRPVYKLLFCFFMLICTVIACKYESTVGETPLLENASALAKANNGELSESNIQIKVASDGFVEGEMSISPDRAQLFTLQPRSKNDITILPKSGQYQALYLRHLIVLNNLENGEKFIFIVSKEESYELLKKLPASYLKDTKIITGYGLSMNYKKILANGARVAADCTPAGGEGSTSCSNDCCSVSCETGYYASCGTVRCVCAKKSELGTGD